MNKIIGVILLVLGGFLLVRGHDISQALNSRVSNLFTGEPTNRAMYHYLGGALCCAVGLVLTFFLPTKK
jgi:uncharacterized membrane protein